VPIEHEEDATEQHQLEALADRLAKLEEADGVIVFPAIPDCQVTVEWPGEDLNAFLEIVRRLDERLLYVDVLRFDEDYLSTFDDALSEQAGTSEGNTVDDEDYEHDDANNSGSGSQFRRDLASLASQHSQQIARVHASFLREGALHIFECLASWYADFLDESSLTPTRRAPSFDLGRWERQQDLANRIAGDDDLIAELGARSEVRRAADSEAMVDLIVPLISERPEFADEDEEDIRTAVRRLVGFHGAIGRAVHEYREQTERNLLHDIDGLWHRFVEARPEFLTERLLMPHKERVVREWLVEVYGFSMPELTARLARHKPVDRPS